MRVAKLRVAKLRVAVIGAGIVGASIAFRLSQDGAKVWVFDRAPAASGTTAASFAWINANNKTPREYFELNRAGMQEHFRLRDESPGGAPWFHPCGNLIQASDEYLEELEHRVSRLQSWGYSAEWSTASRVSEDLEPHVRFPNPNSHVAFFPQEAWVDAPRLTNFFLERAVENGAVVRPGEAVSDIDLNDGRVCGVKVAEGDTVLVDAVANAAGPAADRIAALVGRKLPMNPKDGLLARVAAKPGLLGRLIHTPGVNLRPDGPGHILLHHESMDEKLVGSDNEHLAEELLGRARNIIPALADARIEEVRLGTRPMPADGFACVGGVTGVPGYYEAVTHSGVTLGPLVGRLLAREMLAGDVDPLLAPYRPDRFGS